MEGGSAEYAGAYILPHITRQSNVPEGSTLRV